MNREESGYGAWLDARERTVLVPVHDKRDELGSTRYDYRHARTQARILENGTTSPVRGELCR